MRHTLSLFLILLALFLPAATAAGQPPVIPAGSDGPGGKWYGGLNRTALKNPEPLWSLRTGARKGVLDQALDEELSAGPDGAILRSGLFAEWTGLLAEYRESYALVEPDRIAGLSGTKPFLIIPSGGLSGTASSAFFRAGLAEYARTGGIILCFTQQRGSDYDALPVPEDSKLRVMGAGWAEDSGPLFRSSLVQAVHPVLAGSVQPTPTVETDGYLTAYPPNARVLLSRQDGFPTFILYPVGKGWVAVTTLMSDRNFGQGLLDSEEKILVHNLVLWAKSGGRMAELTAGKTYESTVRITGPEHGETGSVRIMVMGAQQEKPLFESTAPQTLTAKQDAMVPFRYDIPADAPPGILHTEYTLLDAKNRPLTPNIESGEGWFAVMPQKTPPGQTARASQPLAGPAVRLSAMPVVENYMDRARIDLAITRTTGTAGSHDLIVRCAGQERSFTMTQDRTTASFEVPTVQVGRQIAYAVYDRGGRSLARGSVPTAIPQTTVVAVDRPWYFPGQRIKVSVKGLGLGAFTLNGLGTVIREHISKDRTFEVPVPQSLPSGQHPLTWEFETRTGVRKEGDVAVLIEGIQVLCSGVSVTRHLAEKDASLTATLRLSADQAVPAVLRLWPVSPGGKDFPGGERAIALAAGDQDISLSVPFQPDQAGIWTLHYTLTTRLPEGPGFTPDPVLLTAGRVLLDSGDAAVLGLRTDRPIYYEASGPVEIAAVMHGSGPAKIELFLDGKRLRKERSSSPGTTVISVPLPDLAPGPHVVRAAVAGEGLESSREFRFLYGARLPDLAVTIKTSELDAPFIEIGVGVMNQGRAASGATDAWVYDGDPARGGTLIGKAAVPPLAPGKPYVFVAKWPLAGKAGQHTLVAVVDKDARIIEASKSNNSAILSLTVPDLLLSLLPEKSAFRSDEEVRYKVRTINFTGRSLKALSLDLQTTDPAGRKIAADTVNLADLEPGDLRITDRVLHVPALQEGIYLVSVVATADKPLESDSLGISVLPTLLLKGSLEGTPAVAATCRPFSLRYQARNAGNVQPTNGSLKVEVRSADQKQLVYAQQLPFSLEAGTHRVEKLDAPRGDYTVIFRASAVNQPKGLTVDFLLAQQPLRIEGPVDVKRSSAAIPRVLLWSGSDESTNIERAITDALHKEAFSGESIYLKTVTNAGDFTSHALTGLYNVYVLLDIDSAPDTAELLRNSLAKGQGVVLAGSGERMQALAEALEFRFDPALPGKSGSITFPADSVLSITGTIPVTGRILPPRKRGSQAAATLPDGRPAVLFDVQGAGKVIMMPFSLARSAKNAGTTNLYGLLLRSSVLAVFPEHEAPGSIASIQFLVSTNSGAQEKTRIAETLPAGAKVIWTNVPRTLKDRTLTFDVTADHEPTKVLYLYQPADPKAIQTSTEVFTECGGKMVSQGKTE